MESYIIHAEKETPPTAHSCFQWFIYNYKWFWGKINPQFFLTRCLTILSLYVEPLVEDTAMSAHSPIEWTESTWNPLTGCTQVSPGCQHCYAERMSRRLQAMGNKGNQR